jgi:hypothetical protein
MNFFFTVHTLLLLLGIILPFVGQRKYLEFYSILIPILFLHWALNDDTCFLTNLEQMVTDQPKERTFMGRLVGPIYNLSDDSIGKAIKVILFSLWLFLQFKLGHLKTILPNISKNA